MVADCCDISCYLAVVAREEVPDPIADDAMELGPQSTESLLLAGMGFVVEENGSSSQIE